MALPSREFVMKQVDDNFALQHPEAPKKLNPNDPAQAHWVQAWNAEYAEELNWIVDTHFRRFFPDAPRHLDPNDPSQATLIEYWHDIRAGIETGTSQWNWSHPPATHDDSAGSTTGTDGSGSAGGSAGGAGGAEGQHPSGDRPTVTVHIDESHFKEWVHTALEGAHYIGDTAEVLGYVAEAAGAEGSGLVWLGEALGPVGTVASTIVLLWATAHSFGTGRRMQEQQGFCYGVMWQVAGEADHHKGFIDWFNDSAEELRESFYEGVLSGRAKANDASVHNRVMLLVAYYQAHGDELNAAQSRVLNDLWHHVRESDAGRDFLSWPQPQSMGS